MIDNIKELLNQLTKIIVKKKYLHLQIFDGNGELCESEFFDIDIVNQNFRYGVSTESSKTHLTFIIGDGVHNFEVKAHKRNHEVFAQAEVEIVDFFASEEKKKLIQIYLKK